MCDITFNGAFMLHFWKLPFCLFATCVCHRGKEDSGKVVRIYWTLLVCGINWCRISSFIMEYFIFFAKWLLRISKSQVRNALPKLAGRWKPLVRRSEINVLERSRHFAVPIPNPVSISGRIPFILGTSSEMGATEQTLYR